MKESRDRGQIEHYLELHRIEPIFNEQVMPHVSLYSFEKGELICSQGEAAQHLYVLVKGKVKIFTTSAEGRTLILSFKTPLEVIGDIEYVQGIDIINTVEAVTPVSMIGVHHRWLKKYASDSPQLLQFLLEIITRKFCVKSTSLSFNLLHPVDVRLASYLMSVSFDESDAQVPYKLDKANLMDVANLIGTSYRHLNRVIRDFCTDGLVERNKGYIVVKNREGLAARALPNIYESQSEEGPF